MVRSILSLYRYVDSELNNETAIREQRFYREGNAEVLQLMTRGQMEDRSQYRRYPATFIVDGKDVLLQRFMQDQKARHEPPMQETEMRTIDSHQRSRNLYQSKQEILLLPEELDVRCRRAEEMESGTQKLMMDDEYAAQNVNVESQMRDVRRQEISTNIGIMSKDRPLVVKDQQSTTVQSFAIHDLELARQNVLLTRLLLERESRHAGGVMMDTASYLETQSLPGQVAIATQTDRVAATQTERHVRSRSDNDESDEDTRNRKRMKKRHGESTELRTRTLWMKTPIEEEEGPYFDKRLNILRKKVQEVKEGRKVPLEPEVLREISDSLDENGSTYREKERKSTKTCQQYTEESSIGYKVLSEKKNDSSTSTEIDRQHERSSNEKRENLSSPDINIDDGRYIRETMEKKSSRKESRIKKQKKIESVIKPSFRVLEREITMLTKKLSKLADRKQTTGSESTSQEKSKTSKDSKKDSDQSTAKKAEDSMKHKRFETSPSISKEAKEKKFKYQQPQIMSPGSSEYDDAFEKLDKSKLTSRQEAAKHKQISHAKVKRQTQIERKERKKQIVQQDRELEKRRHAASKENGKSKTEKTAKLMSRTQRLGAIGRKEHVQLSEEPSTSTSSDRTNGKKDSFASRDFDKKSTSSEIPSSHAYQQKSKQKLDHVSEKFSDDFVTEPQRRDIDQQYAFHSMTSRNADKKDITNDKEDIEIIQQFSDDFTMESQTKELEHQMQAAVESEILDRQNVYHDFDKEHTSMKEAAVIIESEQDISHDFGKEHLTLKEAAEDLTILRNLEDTQFKSETTLDIASKEQSESFEASDKKLDDNKRTISPDSLALKEHQTEKLPYYNSKSAVEKRIAYMSGKHKEAAEEFVYEIEKEMSEIPEKELHELQRRDAEKIASKETNALEKHIESLKMEHAKEEKEHEENGLHSDIISLPLETEKDSRDIKDVTLHSSEKDETVELYKVKSDQREELNSDSKEHIEEGIPSTKDAIDIEQKMVQELMRENEENLLREIQSEIEKSKELPVTQEFSAQKREELTKEYEEPFDISQSFTDDTKNLNGTQRAFSIHDDTISYIDETSDEASKSDHDLIQSELTELPDTIKKIIDKDELEHLSDDLATKSEIESHETKEESHTSPKKISDLREVKQEKIDEDTSFMASTSKEEVIKEQLQIEHAKEKEEASLEEHEERTEEISTLKERSDEEIFDKKSSVDQWPKDSSLQKSTVNEADEVDSFVIIPESAAVVEPRDEEEQQADVSVPIFSSFIDDILDVSEESDSSSDVSRKTTLSTRPYDTPRHRQKWQQQESIEIAGMSGVRTFKNGGDAKIETVEDTDSNLSLDETEKTEDSITTEATSELKEDMEIAAISEIISSDGERVSSVSDIKEENDKDIKITDGDFVSTVEESESDIKSEIKNLLTTIQDIVPLTLSINELNGISKEDEIPVTREDKSVIITSYEMIEETSKTVEQDIKSEIKLSSKSEQVEESKTTEERKIEDSNIHKIRSKKSDIRLTPEKYVAKIPSERFMKKKKPERLKTSSPAERKRVSDKSEEKVAPSYSQRRSRKFTAGDSQKHTRESQKRSPRREEENQRKQLMPKSKIKTDRKSIVFPKTGEIDTSKTRSKYMAWYNKKREEAEKKRLEKKAADDEELPRWVSRGLKQTTKPRDKLTMERKTLEITSYTRRKIKPLVNVESEQLRAIVRQGRQLRRAEGNLREDPPIEIFARTPPTSTSDTQHRLLQHSEYKYERIPPPFYLHPPPAPHPSPQLSPERSLAIQPCRSQYEQSEDDLHSENAVPFQSGGRLRHQQLLEKKSVFDIAYSEAAPSQLRSDSATPPS